MQEVRRLEEEYARFRQAQPTALTRHEVDQIRDLARDLPALWDAPTTTPADRQQIIRFLVERVEVAVEGVSDRVRVTITWAGGQQTRHEVTRPVGRYEQTADFDRLMARVRELRAAGLSFAAIAEHLNAEGYRPPKWAERFHKDIVEPAAAAADAGRSARAAVDRCRVGRDEWFVIDLAKRLGIGKNTLHAWLQRGWVRYRRLPGYRGRCVCWADAGELERLGRLARTPRGWWAPALPPELTTPKPLPRRDRGSREPDRSRTTRKRPALDDGRIVLAMQYIHNEECRNMPTSRVEGAGIGLFKEAVWLANVDGAAVFQVGGDAGGPEGVAADAGRAGRRPWPGA